ncbi:MAG TPA: hypothetical protein VG960_06225 [Caulobacteraceae bacterium]|nr:hypothetical protein [Caulobacteraceae bacterium]
MLAAAALLAVSNGPMSASAKTLVHVTPAARDAGASYSDLPNGSAARLQSHGGARLILVDDDDEKGACHFYLAGMHLMCQYVTRAYCFTPGHAMFLTPRFQPGEDCPSDEK